MGNVTPETSELIKALSRLAGNRQKDGYSSLVSPEDRETIISGCHDLMLAARSAALSHTPQPVAVKPLEWNKADSWNVAKTIVGHYVVRRCLATNFAEKWIMRRAGQELSDVPPYASEEAAKAAAQADYEARILSALAAPPAAPVVPEGFKLVPIEPTKEMLAEACASDPHPIIKYTTPQERDGSVPLIPIATWRAMLAAAPDAETKP